MEQNKDQSEIPEKDQFRKAAADYRQTDFFPIYFWSTESPIAAAVVLPLIAYAISVPFKIGPIVVLVLSSLWVYWKVEKIKKGTEDVPDTKGKVWIAVAIGFAPVIAQLLFHYRLKDTHPRSGKIYTSFAIKLLKVQLLFFVGLFLIIKGAPNK